MVKGSRDRSTRSTQSIKIVFSFSAALFLICAVLAGTAGAQGDFGLPGTYGLKVYKVNDILYPFVQVYFRTFSKEMQPLVNLNELNIGLMVKGKAYDPAKRQYFIQSLRQRQEATRSAIVLDASKSMLGQPFEAALRACARFIDSKRPQDEISILAIKDTKDGYEVVSEYERDPGALARRLADVRADGKRTRLYDAIGAALQGCGASSQGSVGPSSGAYISSCSVVVMSDGRDDGSAISREELNTRISGMAVPIPIYSLAYSRISPKFFINLESLSKNSFGKYYLIAEAFDRMQRVVEEIQNIIQSDYVLTFRSYIPVDGNEHSFKVGVEYPSGSGKYTYDAAKFEALEAPPVGQVDQKLYELDKAMPALPVNVEPYFVRPGTTQPAAATAQ